MDDGIIGAHTAPGLNAVYEAWAMTGGRRAIESKHTYGGGQARGEGARWGRRGWVTE